LYDRCWARCLPILIHLGLLAARSRGLSPQRRASETRIGYGGRTETETETETEMADIRTNQGSKSMMWHSMLSINLSDTADCNPTILPPKERFIARRDTTCCLASPFFSSQISPRPFRIRPFHLDPTLARSIDHSSSIIGRNSMHRNIRIPIRQLLPRSFHAIRNNLMRASVQNLPDGNRNIETTYTSQ
jgi:hypothetical protein